MSNEIKDLSIIGAGPVGLFAAFQAGMLGLSANIIDLLDKPGGQCSHLYPEKYIYDIPGYPKITGQELTDKLVEQAASMQPTYLLGKKIISMHKDDDGIISLGTASGETIRSRALFITTGGGTLEPNKIPLPVADKLYDSKIFYSVPSKEIFRDKTVLICGGGDSAVDWVMNLTDWARKIYLLHRRSKFTAIPHNVEQILGYAEQNPGALQIITGYQLKDIQEDAPQQDYTPLLDTSAPYSDQLIVDLERISEQDSMQIAVDYILAFYGLKKQPPLAASWGIDYAAEGIPVDFAMQTNIAGIYAAGDIAHYPNKLKLILTGFAECSTACHSVYAQIHGRKPKHEYSTTKGIG